MSFAKQLDFLSRLVARAIPQAAPPAPAPRGDDEALADRCRELLRGLSAEALATQVRVRWNSRMRSTAGTAYPGKALITLNPRLREFGEDELDRTLRHELAHLLAHHRAGRRRIAPHGREWRRAC
jgi:SprT protein